MGLESEKEELEMQKKYSSKHLCFCDQPAVITIFIHDRDRMENQTSKAKRVGAELSVKTKKRKKKTHYSKHAK